MPYGPKRHDFEDSDLRERYIVELPKSASHWTPPSCYLEALEESKLDIQSFAKRQGASVKAELPHGDSIQTKYSFYELPLTKATLAGLKKYAFMTKIQFLTIPHILQGRDIIAEAATGGGKTLCFVVPILEALRRELWQREDGCFALIMTPTRELALQIFEVIALFKEHTAVSAMTVFGGKHMIEEQKRIRDIGIVIGTPGRILSHLEETYQFTTEGIKMVVLDEADKLIELGFLETTERILAALPAKEDRQNLFFSATLRSASRLLARKFCNQDNCEKITEQFEGIVDLAATNQPAGPSRLRHTFMTIKNVDDKIATLYSLMCANFKKKIIVFCSTIKQVRYLYETFTEMKTGARILEIHGKQDQEKRMYVFDEFNRRQAAISIISTDLLGRGVDFPNVDLVIQFDCPPDVATYTHRAGRTARGVERSGESLLLLLSSEQLFLSRLKEKGFSVEPALPLKYVRDTTPNLRGLCARRADIKQLAIKFYLSTIKAYSLLKDTEVFKVQSLLMRRSAFVASLGLVNIPELPSELANLAVTDAEKLTTPETQDMDADEIDGGVHKSAKVKNRSRLDRLKDKIAAKAAAKKEASGGDDRAAVTTAVTTETNESDEEGPKISRREKRRQKLQEIRQMGAADLMKDDTKIDVESRDLRVVDEDALVEAADQSVPVTEAPVDLQNWRDSEQVKKALRKQRLVIRADGTAKIKGAAKLIPVTHKYFGPDDDEAVDPTTFEGALRMMDIEGESEHVVETREERIQRIQASLKEARAAETVLKAAKRQRHKKSAETLMDSETVVEEADLESRLASEFNL